MLIQTRCARVTGPLTYLNGSGRKQNVPLGPCLVEVMGGRFADVIWGTRGQRSVAFPLEDIEAAQHHGHLEFIPGAPA